LVLVGLCKSNNEARQKITEGAVNYGPSRTKVGRTSDTISVSDGLVVRLGRNILRVRVK
jgi:tyrosyl-tRNA synthetase